MAAGERRARSRDSGRVMLEEGGGGAAPLAPRFAHTAVLVTIAAVLALTMASVVVMLNWHHAADRERYDHLEEKLRTSVVQRVTDHRHGLQSVRGLVLAGEMAAGHVASQQPQGLPHRPAADGSASARPGADCAPGLGFGEAVASLNLGAAFPAAERVGRLGLPGEGASDRFPVLFQAEVAGWATPGLESLEQSPQTTRALSRATLLGRSVFADTPSGMFLLLPVYEGGMTPVASERVGLSRGWVFMRLNREALFAGLTDDVNEELDVRLLTGSGETLFDSRRPTAEAQATRAAAPRFGAEGSGEPVASGGLGSEAAEAGLPPLHRVVPMQVAGRKWTMETARSPGFRARPTGDVWLAGLVGVILAGLLAALQHGHARLASRAEALARQMTRDLREAALTDRLTGLANRPALLHRVQESIELAAADPGYHHAVLFLDFDRFKIINDSLGHQSGDRLLRAIADRIQGQLRAEDVAAASNGRPGQRSVEGLGCAAARFGGDEFLIALEGLKQPGDAVAVADRLLQALAEPYDLGGREVVSTASIGVVVGDAGYRWAEEMIRDADTAMYEAKDAGRAAWVLFDKAMRERVALRLQVETDLRGAAERGEFELFYQPIMDLSGGAVDARIHRWEALIRWNHPTRGKLAPDVFIPVAEETGLIHPIGAWVINEAMRQLACWRAEGVEDADHWKVGINLARQQLRGTDLIASVQGGLARHGIDAESLHLEVTETEVMADPEGASAVLEGVRALGVSVDMDDFGIGHSSLASLDQFPLDVIKIDRSFVADLQGDRRRVAMLSTVARLARDLEMDVVAEGIETAEQLAQVTRLQCSHGQGYFFSKPLPAAEVPKWATARLTPVAAGPAGLRYVEPPAEDGDWMRLAA